MGRGHSPRRRGRTVTGHGRSFVDQEQATPVPLDDGAVHEISHETLGFGSRTTLRNPQGLESGLRHRAAAGEHSNVVKPLVVAGAPSSNALLVRTTVGHKGPHG